MELLLLLLILGFVLYYSVKSHTANNSRFSLWIFWLVLMLPPIVWVLWGLIMGTDKPIPPILVIGPFIISPMIFWWLLDKGKPDTPSPEDSPMNTSEIDSPNPSPEPLKIRPITQDEEQQLRHCFPWKLYQLQTIDYHPQAILCRGRLQTVPETAYDQIKHNVENIFGDRFLIVFQENLRGQPIFALVPNPWSQQSSINDNEPITRPFLALGLLFMTLLTTSLSGIEISGINIEQLNQNPSLWLKGIPYSLGLIAILGLHELSHYLTAVFYKIRTTLPYFIPIPFFLGTFGAFISMRSPVPHRKALFDVSIAGPIGGIIITLPLLFWGLSLSEVVPLTDKSSLLNFENINPHFSLLLAVISKWAIGNQLTATMGIHLHPLAVAGYIGLIMTALNLIPVGQLDGGHIVHAMFGQRMAMTIGQITRLLIFLLSFTQPDFLLWAILLLLMPLADQPALNDITELDNKRDFLGMLSLVFLATILLPLPKGLGGILGI